MLKDEDHWHAVADLFSSAPLDGDWPAALNALADACGGRSGELIGFGAEAALFNHTTRYDPVAMAEWAAMDAYSPRVNPRVRVGLQAPAMAAWHEVNCIAEEEMRRNPDHAELCRRWDLPYGSQTNVVRTVDMVIGLSVTRGAAAGIPAAGDRRVFESLAPVARAAVLAQLAVEQQGAQLMAGALEAMHAAAFLCDWSGRVRALTPAAEAAVAAGPLRLSGGLLSAPRAEDSRRLADAIRAATGSAAASATIVIGGAGALDIELVDVAPLPNRSLAFRFQPRALVTIRKPARRDAALPGILAATYGLTPAEAEIAVALANGQDRRAIAAERSISIQTLRTHLKRIFTKLEVSRESQLVARLQRLR